MTGSKVYDEAAKVTARKGDVVLEGPGGVDVIMTPDAALETSQRLLDAAAEAQGQRFKESTKLT